MKRLVLALVLAAVPTLFARAQAPQQTVFNLHGHPQLATYASPAQWPFFDAQGWWSPQSNPPVAGTTPATVALGHLHIGLTCPFYAEITGPFTCSFTIKMFQWNGTLGGFGGINVTNIVFDGPAVHTVFNFATGVDTTISTLAGSGTATPTVGAGDPQPFGLIVENGHLTIDPTYVGGNGPGTAFPPRGWTTVQIVLGAYLANGTHIDEYGKFPFYSLLNASAPDTGSPNPELIGDELVYPATTHALGEGIVEMDGYLPILPISAPWPIKQFMTFNYAIDSGPGVLTGPEVAPGFTELSLDGHVHMGQQGTQLLTQLSGSTFPQNLNGVQFGVQSQTPVPPYLIDPSSWTVGKHSLLARWEQPTGSTCNLVSDGTGFMQLCSGDTAHFQGGEQAVSNLLIPVTVAVVPPPGTAPFPALTGSGMPPQPPPPPSPCMTTPLTITSSGLLTAIQNLVNQMLAAVSITVTDTRGCTASASSGS